MVAGFANMCIIKVYMHPLSQVHNAPYSNCKVVTLSIFSEKFYKNGQKYREK
jgi:hypothetical protein